MDCQEAERRLSERSPDELSDGDRAAVAAHLASCSACRERWGALFPASDDGETPPTVRTAVEPSASMTARTQRTELVSEGSGGEPTVPRRIAGYETLGLLGSGGMGLVVKAQQVSMDRVVALKIVPQRPVQDPAFVKRFVREARSAAKLRHPNVVQAYDAGLADGYYFFAMEYVDGESLRDILRREGALRPDRALEYAKQACRALAAAAAAGIVHRDIKPSNLMIDSAGVLRVTDFGLAKRTEGDTTATAAGQLLGTPAYVSPEMASNGRVDARSDLYSLGATLYHLLAGKPPFESHSFSEAVIKAIREEAPPLAGTAPHVDRRLCGIVDRLLCKSPDARHSSAQALLAELDALGELTCAEQPALPPADAETATTLRADAPPKAKLRGTAFRASALIAALAAAIIVWLLCAPSRPRAFFDGQTLGGWRIVERFDVSRQEGAGDGGSARVEQGRLILEPGHPLTGIAWTGDFPKLNYEVALDAMRLSGTQDFCILIFPVNDEWCALEVGGWKENLVGLDAINGLDPWHNGTCRPMAFEQRRWYHIRLRVTDTAIAVWVGKEQVIDLPTAGHRFSLHEKWKNMRPFGLGTAWATGAAFRALTRRAVREELAPGGAAIVLGRAAWHNSGIELAKGRRYTLAATGRWGHSSLHSVGPEGDPEDTTGGLPLPGAAPYCLIGRVGTGGAPFAIGARHTLAPKQTGHLYLQMNDRDRGDNIGSLRVSVLPMAD